MSKIKSATINMIKNNYLRSTTFKILLGGLIVVGIIYAYYIISITFNIVARRSLENRAQLYSSSISQLELTYFSNLNKINKDYAVENGFVDSNNNIFAIRSNSYVAIR